MKLVLTFLVLPLFCFGQTVDTVYLDGDADTVEIISSGYAISTSNGKKTSEGLYKDGLEEGLWTYWYRDGNRDKWMEGHYGEGQKEGLWRTWDEQGKLFSEENYNHNILFGLRTTYHPNGNKASEVVYVNGSREGLLTEWNSDGSIVNQEEFKNDLSTRAPANNENPDFRNENPHSRRLVFLVVLILTALMFYKISSAEERKRIGKTLALGCLAPFVVVIPLFLILFGGNHPQDAGAAVGLFIKGAFVVVVVLPIVAISWLVWFIWVWRSYRNADVQETIPTVTMPAATIPKEPQIVLTPEEIAKRERKKKKDDKEMKIFVTVLLLLILVVAIMVAYALLRN